MLWIKCRAILAILFLVFTLPSFAQSQKPLNLDDISNLIKSGVTPNRVAQLVEERGVGFELDDRALRQLKQDGANDTVLSAIKKMSARYTEARQKARQEQEQQAKRKEDERRKATEQKNQQAKVTQKATPKTEEAKAKTQDEATQRSQKPILRTAQDVGRITSLRNLVTTEQGEVSGDVVNHTKQTLREVRLQIVYSWRWSDEYHPGKDDPGRAVYHTLEQEIPPGQTTRFNYNPSPPLASRQDGQFEISVKVAGFAQVFPGAPQK